MIILSREESWFLVTIAVSLVAIYKAANLVSRSDIVKLSFFLGIFQALMSFSYGLVNQSSFGLMMLMIVFSVFSGILTGMVSLAVLPYFEDYFDILTTMKLLELSDFSHTLLKQLLIKAPGTFHHSIMVGALAEGAAESIGANATFARIASYYHDIGKMKRPEFFVENQRDGVNPHNKIKPSLSALILTSHTKDGYIMYKNQKDTLVAFKLTKKARIAVTLYFTNKENADYVKNTFKRSAPSAVQFLDEIENDRAYIQRFKDSQEGLYSYNIIAKNQKVDGCYITIFFSEENDLTIDDLNQKIDSLLNEVESYLK